MLQSRRHTVVAIASLSAFLIAAAATITVVIRAASVPVVLACIAEACIVAAPIGGPAPASLLTGPASMGSAPASLSPLSESRPPASVGGVLASKSSLIDRVVGVADAGIGPEPASNPAGARVSIGVRVHVSASIFIRSGVGTPASKPAFWLLPSVRASARRWVTVKRGRALGISRATCVDDRRIGASLGAVVADERGCAFSVSDAAGVATARIGASLGLLLQTARLRIQCL